jgi:hypothetical protein
MAFNPFGPAGTATQWSGVAGSEPQGYIAAGTGNGKGPSLGSLWGGAKQADKLGILGYGEKLLGGLFGGGSGLSTPNKGDFSYGGMGEGGFQSLGQQLYGRAPVQANLDQFNQSRGLGMQSRGDIGNQISTLRNLANDEKASQAYWQMKAGGNQNMTQALALARAGGGSGASQGAALRQAQMGNMAAGQQLNQQVGMMRAQETAAANQQISGLMAQQRAMDLQASGLDAQTAMQQAQLELGSQQLGQQGLLGMYGLGQNAAALEQKGLSDYWKTLLGAEAAQMQAKNQGLSALVGGGAALGAAFLSDEQTKMNVMPIYGSPLGTNPMATAGGPVGSGAEMKQNIVPFGTPGQPQITTGGAMTMPTQTGVAMGNMYDAQEAADKQAFRDRFGQASTIFSAFQPQGQVDTSIQDPANYLPTISDARAKELSTENAALRSQLGQMQLAIEQGKPYVPKSAAQAQQYGERWVQNKKAEALGDNPRMPMTRRGEIQQAIEQGQRFMPRDAGEAALYGQLWKANKSLEAGVAPPPMYDVTSKPRPGVLRVESSQPVSEYDQARLAQTTTSDENAKRLRGMLDAAENRLIAYEDMFGALPRATGNTDEWAQRAGESSGIRPQSLDMAQGPRPMAARAGRIDPITVENIPRGSYPLAKQAAAIPSAAWNYDPQHAAQANVKNGQPPDAPFGRMQKTGPMAQDLLRVPATRGAVMQGPDGMLQVDGGQVAMSGLGMIGDLARQNAELEERLRRIERSGTAVKNIDDPAMWWDSGI